MRKNEEISQNRNHSNVTIPDSKTIARKKRSKWLKFLGAALLLFAFGMQTWQNSQMALVTERTQAAELQSRTLQKAIGYETLYFAAKTAGIDDPRFLTLTAREYFIGSSAMMVTAPGDKNEIGRKVQALEKTAASVRDIESLNTFLALDNQFEVEGHANEMSGLTEPDAHAKFLARFYLVLYVFGSAAALIGQALD